MNLRIILDGTTVEDARYFCVETGKTYAGRTLMHLGLSAELNGDFDSGVFYFQAVKEG